MKSTIFNQPVNSQFFWLLPSQLLIRVRSRKFHFTFVCSVTSFGSQTRVQLMMYQFWWLSLHLLWKWTHRKNHASNFLTFFTCFHVRRSFSHSFRSRSMQPINKIESSKAEQANDARFLQARPSSYWNKGFSASPTMLECLDLTRLYSSASLTGNYVECNTLRQLHIKWHLMAKQQAMRVAY